MSDRFIHIEIVHPDPDAAARFIQEVFGGVPVEPRMSAHLESVMEGMRCVHVQVGGCVLQFVRPNAAMESWQRQLDTQGPGVHNITFELDDFEAVTAALRDRGAETLLAVDDVDLRPAGLSYEGELPVQIIDAREQSGLRFELFSSKAGWKPGETP